MNLYQIHTRLYLAELSRSLGHPATLDDITNVELTRLAWAGFDWLYLLGIWQNGEASRQIARALPALRAECTRLLPDLQDEDLCGSCFAIAAYQVPTALGGNGALERLLARMHRLGLRLMLDFVPNHTALDHPWVQTHPEYYLAGTPEQAAQTSNAYVARPTCQGERWLAHGRDPYFPPWSDTLQLNYCNPAVVSAMNTELEHIVSLCDGVRCDMAMLVLPEIFARTWNCQGLSFWPEAIENVRRSHPGFLFMAEVYWDLEWELQKQGFDYTYDKRLYDRLRGQHARPVRQHLQAGLNYQGHMVHFLENHDEPRAAAAFPLDIHQAAALITYLAPGVRFFHQGQLHGLRLHLPGQLCRAPQEANDTALQTFYECLLNILERPALHQGEWNLLIPEPAWEGNWTWDGFVAYSWRGAQVERLLGIVNYSPHQSQCYLRLPFEHLSEHIWRLRDLLSETSYLRDGKELAAKGLYLDLPAWGYHVFEMLIG